jgi:L-ascorbate metabolism protein UlaG (beta-lactamase superfamily)
VSASLGYLGHATVLIDLDGVRFVTDPLLRRRVAYLRRLVATPAVPEDVDAILLSHGHQDHLDLGSLRRLDRDARVLVPAGLGTLVSRRGFGAVEEVEAGDEREIGGVAVRVTRAVHEGGRPPLRPRAGAVGYALLGSTRIYFAGDTDLFPELDGLVPELDVALVPVWGWGRKADKGHLDPERAAEAVRLLRPRIAIPIHWGTYMVAGGAWRSGREPADAFAENVARVAPDVEVRVLEPGESTEV